MVNQGYKQTEIGLIPEDWEVKELNTLSKITRLAGYEYSTYWKEDRSGEIIGLRGFNIGKNKIIDREFSFISDSLSKKLNRSRLYKNDIIYPCVGTIGNACVITEDDKYHIQQNIAKITPNISLVYPYYLSHFLMSDFGLKEIERFNGSSSQPNVLVGSLRKYNIILPPLAEQEAIASALSDADAWIEHLEQLIAKKRLIKQGAMQELLTPKEEWEVKKLGEVGEIITGGTPSTLNKEFWGSDIPWITPTDININKNIYYGERNITELGLKQIRPLPANTLLVTCIASIGKNAILRVRGACNQQINAVVPNSNFNVEFLYYLLELKKSVLQGKAGVTATPILSKAEFSTIEFSFPSLSEQERIATILSDMDAELEALEQQLGKAQQIKQGMMQELLTGRVRLV